MRRGERFPSDQAEIIFSDVFVEYLDGLGGSERERVLSEVVGLCENPAGKHPLSNTVLTPNLVGWNTLDVLAGEHRVVFASRLVNGVGTIEVLCAGPRRADAVYTMADALIRSGRLTDEEVAQIWEALSMLEVIAEQVGLDGWDYAPEPAPEGLRRAVVAAGVLSADIVGVLSKDEINAAMEQGWGDDGPDRDRAMQAVLSRSRSNLPIGGAQSLADRVAPRCNALMPRAKRPCIRRAQHPGAHRSVA